MSTPWGGSCASSSRATGRRLAASAGWLVKLASTSTPAELHKALTVEVDQLRAEDGVSRLARQRRATRLDTWIDDEGMWCLRGRFDPETGLTLQGRLANTVAALFADKTPDDCPFHPLERQAFLRAHALAALTEGHGTRSAGARDRRRRRSHRPATRRDPDRRLGAPRRAARRGAAPPVRHRPRPPDHRAPRGCPPRPRLPRPGPHHPGGQPGPTPRPARPLQDVRHPRLRHPLRPLPAPPHHLVGTRRHHRPRQPPALVRPTPPRRARPRLAPRPGRRPVLDHHLPRRHQARPPAHPDAAATARHARPSTTEQPAHDEAPALLRC